MKRFRLTLSVVLGSVAAAAGVLACSGDDTIVPVVGSDGGTDATLVDNFVPGTDGGGIDTGTDTSVPDTGVDAGFDANFDASPVAPQDFVNAISQTLCTRFAACCGGFGFDASSFNTTKCNASVGAVGFGNASLDVQNLLNSVDGGATPNITVDPLGAATCTSLISALPCTTTTAAQKQALAACFAAIKGKLTAGQTCTSTVECQAPAYCKIASGANTGTCSALEAVNSACSSVAPGNTPDDQAINAQGACTERLTGQPAVYCDTYNTDFSVKDAAAWKCTTSQGDDAGCVFNDYCQSDLCDKTSTCAEVSPLITSGACGFYQ